MSDKKTTKRAYKFENAICQWYIPPNQIKTCTTQFNTLFSISNVLLMEFQSGEVQLSVADPKGVSCLSNVYKSRHVMCTLKNEQYNTKVDVKFIYDQFKGLTRKNSVLFHAEKNKISNPDNNALYMSIMSDNKIIKTVLVRSLEKYPRIFYDHLSFTSKDDNVSGDYISFMVPSYMFSEWSDRHCIISGSDGGIVNINIDTQRNKSLISFLIKTKSGRKIETKIWTMNDSDIVKVKSYGPKNVCMSYLLTFVKKIQPILVYDDKNMVINVSHRGIQFIKKLDKHNEFYLTLTNVDEMGNTIENYAS